MDKIIDEQLIRDILTKTATINSGDVFKILDRSQQKRGLNLLEVACLTQVRDPALLQAMFTTARKIKEEIYGERLVFFAPLYVSSFCVNNCAYCGFRRVNSLPRKKLTLVEVAEQVEILIGMGHKRLLLEFGEDVNAAPIDYVLEVIKTVYATKQQGAAIRRININLAATTVDNYRQLKNAQIGTYQLFQETYHRPTYEKLHHGPKADYERQLFAHNLALTAGLDDIGLGVLFGLYDWRFEVLALVAHAQYLEKKFGIGPHTISVPRWQPARGVKWLCAPAPVKDDELLKIIAILRLAVPYTGMIISTREQPALRAQAFTLGISQTSAASKTSPGGYGQSEQLTQFNVSDERSVDEVIASILEQELLPSFCTACYRLGRTGENFMNLAKPGEIQNFCRPNALLTFQEYLEDYASSSVRARGALMIEKYLAAITDQKILVETKRRLARITQGERDIYF